MKKNIEAPEDIMTPFERKIASVKEDITVKDFEEKNNALIHLIFDREKMRFPADDLNIKEMCVTYDEYQ